MGHGRKQRQLRNLLLDRHFQLKYTGYLVAISLLLSISLGVVLFRMSSEVITQSEHNVEQGARIVTLGREVVEESRKVSAVVRMNIVKDPVYRDNPDLLDAFNGDAKVQDKRLEKQNAELEAQSQSLSAQAERIRRFQRGLLWSLVGALTLLVLAIGVAGIFVTHKVAGPIFKMRRHLEDVASGNLQVPRGLRKGDELVEFFASFQAMVVSLRETRQRQIDQLDQVMRDLEDDLPREKLEGLERMRASLESALR